MDKATLSALLQKYREGNCTPEEETILLDWLDKLAQDELPVTNKSRIKRQMEQNIFPAKRNYYPLKIAAVILPLIIATYFLFPRQTNWQIAENTSNTLQYIKLPDSTKVVLGKNTKIKYAIRSVQLIRGKAFFDAVTDAEVPFTVQDSLGVLTTVLGTSFTAEITNNTSIIAVSSGSVKVNDIILKPAQRVTITNNKAIKDSIITTDIIAWTKGEIILRNASLQELMQTIQHQYGVKATTKLNVAEGNYTFRIPATMPLNEVLDIIQKISYKPKIHFKMQRDQLSIY